MAEYGDLYDEIDLLKDQVIAANEKEQKKVGMEFDRGLVC
jgi:hypothetical protein